MSYVISTGVFTPQSGSESAAPGNVLQSATWNSIFTDLATNGLTFLGQGKFQQQVPLPSLVTLYASPVQQNVNFAATSGDIASFAINLPTSVSFYRVNSLVIYGAAATLASATVSLFTAASGGGTTVIGSTATTVTATAVGTANALQIIQPSVSTLMLNAANLFLHVTSSTAGSSTANCVVRVEPLF